MMTQVIGLCIGLAIVSAAWKIRRMSRKGILKTTVFGLLMVNGIIALSAGALLLMDPPALAQEGQSQQQSQGQQASGKSGGGWSGIAAAIAVGFGSLAAGIAVAVTGSAAIGGMTQNPEIFGRSLVFVGLAEGIAIYGLIIAFMLVMGFGG